MTLIPSDTEPTNRGADSPSPTHAANTTGEEDSPSSTNTVFSDSQESSRSQPLEHRPDSNLNRPQGLAKQTDRPSSGMSEAAAPRISQTRIRQTETHGSSMYSTISDTESELSSAWQTAQRRRTKKRQAKPRPSQLDAITPAVTTRNQTPSGNSPSQQPTHNPRTPTPPIANTYMTDVVNGVIPAIVINKGFQGNLAPINRDSQLDSLPMPWCADWCEMVLQFAYQEE